MSVLFKRTSLDIQQCQLIVVLFLLFLFSVGILILRRIRVVNSVVDTNGHQSYISYYTNTSATDSTSAVSSWCCFVCRLFLPHFIGLQLFVLCTDSKNPHAGLWLWTKVGRGVHRFENKQKRKSANIPTRLPMMLMIMMTTMMMVQRGEDVTSNYVYKYSTIYIPKAIK